MPTLAATLATFNADTLVVRTVVAVLQHVPGSPALPEYALVDDAARALSPGVEESVLVRVRELANDEVATRVLDLGAHIDGADRVLGKLASPGSSLDAQAADAVMKLLALSWMAGVTGGAGTPGERVERFRRMPAGRALIATWAALDVAIPLGGAELDRLVAAHLSAQASRLASMAGEHVMDGVSAVSDALLPTLQRVVDACARRGPELTLAVAPFVPGLVGPGEGAEERVAAQADRLPIYKWLSARLAAEHAALRAGVSLGG